MEPILLPSSLEINVGCQNHMKLNVTNPSNDFNRFHHSTDFLPPLEEYAAMSVVAEPKAFKVQINLLKDVSRCSLWVSTQKN